MAKNIITLHYTFDMCGFDYEVEVEEQDYIEYLWEAYGYDTVDRPTQSHKELISIIQEKHSETVGTPYKPYEQGFIEGLRFGVADMLSKIVREFTCVQEWLDDDDGFIEYLKDLYYDEAKDAFDHYDD